MLNLNYDRKFDILYVRFQPYTPSYGEDDGNGVVTYYDIETDNVTGMALFDAKKRLEDGAINSIGLPIPIDMSCDTIRSLIYCPERGYKCKLSLA